MSSGPIHAFLAGTGRDGARRRLAEVVAFDNARIEGVHDFIQWCFPLSEASRAVRGAPMLTSCEIRAIRSDPAAQDGLRAALARMTEFYTRTDGWLCAYDHNHLRITRIIAAVRNLLGFDEARRFHALITTRNEEAGSPINAESLGYWRSALDGS